MSKIGRKPIPLTGAKVTIQNNTVSVTGAKGKFSHELPASLTITQKDNRLVISAREKSREDNMVWGLHRALLANKIKGVEKGFETTVRIEGLGFKAQLSGKKMVFTLGFSHKIDFDIPEGVEIAVDKTGQILTLKSNDKWLLGNCVDQIQLLRPPEPYKGTGIIKANQKIIRKAGKAKGAAGS